MDGKVQWSTCFPVVVVVQVVVVTIILPAVQVVLFLVVIQEDVLFTVPRVTHATYSFFGDTNSSRNSASRTLGKLPAHTRRASGCKRIGLPSVPSSIKARRVSSAMEWSKSFPAISRARYTLGAAVVKSLMFFRRRRFVLPLSMPRAKPCTSQEHDATESSCVDIVESLDRATRAITRPQRAWIPLIIAATRKLPLIADMTRMAALITKCGSALSSADRAPGPPSALL